MSLFRKFSLILLIQSTFLSQHIFLVNSQPAVPSTINLSNLTSKVLENRVVQNLRSATDNLSNLVKSSPESSQRMENQKRADDPMKIKEMLKLLEGQNAKVGDSCDSSKWSQHMKPIYDALYMGNTAEQNKKNDEFALAILKDHSIISKVCLSAAHIMECQSGKCVCLTKLPADLNYAINTCMNKTSGNSGGGGVRSNTEGGGAGDGGGGGAGAAGALAGIIGFFQNLFASFTSAGRPTCVGQFETVLICCVGVICHYLLFKK